MGWYLWTQPLHSHPLTLHLLQRKAPPPAFLAHLLLLPFPNPVAAPVPHSSHLWGCLFLGYSFIPSYCRQVRVEGAYSHAVSTWHFSVLPPGGEGGSREVTKAYSWASH